jgi:large subunit ribosomal protein L33
MKTQEKLYLTKAPVFTILPLPLPGRPGIPRFAGHKVMAKSKNDIKLVSSANTGFFYVTKKNPKNNTNKLELKKYDPVVRKHVVFKEGKIKESKK